MLFSPPTIVIFSPPLALIVFPSPPKIVTSSPVAQSLEISFPCPQSKVGLLILLTVFWFPPTRVALSTLLRLLPSPPRIALP